MKNFLAGSRVHYGWIVVVVTFITMLGAAGIRATPTVLILPLEHEFGWDRATISLAISINLILFGLCGPFAAAVMERVGMRATMAGALLLLAAAVGLTTQLSAAWQLVLLWGVLVGLGTGAMSGWIAATVSNRWFVARRGLVVGILTVANATGQLIFLPVLASLSTSAGWRMAVLLVAGCALLVIPLVVLFVRNYPEDMGLQAYGASGGVPGGKGAAPAQGPVAAALSTLRRGLGNRDFLLLAGTFFICGASTNGLIGTHLIPASHDHGIPEVTAASLLALIGVFDVAGTLVSGWLSDRFDSRKLLAWYYSLRGLSLLFLPYAFEAGLSPLAIFVVFYGLDWVATVPPTVRLASDLFGKQHAGRVYAWVLAAHQLGAAAIAYGAGSLRQWLGTYSASFVLSGLLCLLAGAMAMRIVRPAAASEGLAASGQ
ncbi:MAG: major facilitator superfamily 1 [Symbiobacteriaceae bacterium]|nr:major facilitator superfamily 1 [Symbiobacteriaceae bacterium]